MAGLGGGGGGGGVGSGGGEEKLRDPRTQPVRPAGTRVIGIGDLF